MCSLPRRLAKTRRHAHWLDARQTESDRPSGSRGAEPGIGANFHLRLGANRACSDSVCDEALPRRDRRSRERQELSRGSLPDRRLLMAPVKEITLTIDEQKITVPAGTT